MFVFPQVFWTIDSVRRSTVVSHFSEVVHCHLRHFRRDLVLCSRRWRISLLVRQRLDLSDCESNFTRWFHHPDYFLRYLLHLRL